MVTGKCHAELTHSSGCQRRTNQHRRRRRERAKKIQSALPFLTHTLLPWYLLLLLFFGYHISSAMSPVGIFVFPFQFAKVSAVFHALSQSLNLPYYAIQFSSVQLGTGSGSVQFRCEPMCADLTASVAMWKL